MRKTTKKHFKIFLAGIVIGNIITTFIFYIFFHTPTTASTVSPSSHITYSLKDTINDITEHFIKETLINTIENKCTYTVHLIQKLIQNRQKFTIPVPKVQIVEATAYVPSAGGINCAGNCNYTATMLSTLAIKPHYQYLTYCAVDPSVIPFGSLIFIPRLNKSCIAVDTGGAIKGAKIDIMFNSLEAAHRWGRRKVKVYIIPPSIKNFKQIIQREQTIKNNKHQSVEEEKDLTSGHK